MKKYIIVGILAILTLSVVVNLDKVLIETMYLVDWYGSATGTTTVEVIDGLNEIYYTFYE